MGAVNTVVVSLFNGMSCGRLALLSCSNINVLRYYSSEVDKYAIQVADTNYPQDVPHKLGDVRLMCGTSLRSEILKEFPGASILLLGGSPCQSFSFAGKKMGASTKCAIEITTLEQYLELKRKGFEFDGQSYLFWEYVRIKKELQPDHFLLENVMMSKKWFDVISGSVGGNSYIINSSLLVAQTRKRIYWTSVENLPEIQDLGITVSDVLPDNTPPNTIGKFKPSVRLNVVREYESIAKSCKNIYSCMCTSGWQDNRVGIRKCPTLRASGTCTLILTKNKSIRQVTPEDCEILQGVPSGYTDGVSKTQRLKMLGNGWTVPIIAHILGNI